MARFDRSEILKKAEELGRKAKAAGKAGVDKLKGGAKATVEEVKLKTGSAAGRANENLKSGTRPKFTNQRSNTGPTPEPKGGRVVNDTTKLSNKVGRGLKFAGRVASRASGPLAAGFAGFEAGQAIVGSDFGKRQLRDFNIGGLGELDISGNPTIDALNAPGLTRPPTDSGGFFSTDARSLNPNRFVEELDQGQNGSGSLTRDQLLRGEQFNPDEPNVPLGDSRLRTEGRTFATTADEQDPEAPVNEQDPNNKRVSLREALTGFERTDNALGDALALKTRLGLAGEFNKGLNTRNQFGLDQKKFGLEQDEFGETKRQNDFDNAIDLHSAQLDEATLAGTISQAAADGRKNENKVLMDALGNADTTQQKTDITFTQARKDNFDPESLAVQTMFSVVMREVAAEEDSAVGKIFNAIMPGFLGGGDPFSSIADSFDGTAPLLDADSMSAFSIQDGGLFAVKEEGGPPSFVINLSDLPDTSSQFLQSVFARRKQSLRQ